MDPKTIIARLRELEDELASIRSAVAFDHPRGVAGAVRSLVRFLLSYWVILSFATALITAIYVKYAFEIDYFEQYREQATKKKLSEMHRNLADRLLARTEWEAAAEAYRQALQINSHNQHAVNGLVKAQAFLPHGKQKFATAEVIDARLEHLEKEFPDDYIVLFLKGVRRWQMNDLPGARAAIHRSLALNPDWPGGHLLLGYMAQQDHDLAEAIDHYRRALQFDPNNATASNNLGFMYLLSHRYKEAAKYLLQSDAMSPRMLTGLNLGDALRYQGNFAAAMSVHKTVIDNVRRIGNDEDSYTGGHWLYNFMPLADTDTQTVKHYIVVQTLEQKLAIARFALALDHAAVGNLADAGRELEAAVKLEGTRFNAFYDNRLAFMQRLPVRGERTKKWLEEQRAKLWSK